MVCALLAILLALALPNLTSSKRAAREQTAKGKLAAIGAQETSFKTLLGKRRYGTLSELQGTTAGGSPLLTGADTSVPASVYDSAPMMKCSRQDNSFRGR